MTHEEQGFLQNIIANPTDDALRLILADWLDERGDVRGEFVRVQVELAALAGHGCHNPKCWDQKSDCPEHANERRQVQLMRRERELLQCRWQEWCPLSIQDGFKYIGCPNLWDGDDPGGDGPCFTFRRGFVAHVTCALRVWCGTDCRHCGTPEWRRDHPNVTPGNWSADCPVCHGTGRINAHGPALVRAAPLEIITLSDRRPRQTSPVHWYWTCLDANLHEAQELPSELFALLPPQVSIKTGRISPARHHRIFPSEVAALAAKSAACLAWAKATPCV